MSVLRKLLLVLTALTAVLLGGVGTGTAATPRAAAPAQVYDASPQPAPDTAVASEHGPPAVADDDDAAPPSAARGSRGALARPQRGPIWGDTAYDHTIRFAPSCSPISTTRTASGRRAADSRRIAVASVAAKALTPLEQGAAKVPGEWGPGLANRDLGGTRWFDPAVPKANGIRIDKGVPNSSFPSHQVDHVIVRSGGRILGPDGKPIVGSLKQNPDAHIPLSDWLNWTSWNAP